MPLNLNSQDVDFARRFANFLDGKRDDVADVESVVAEIIQAVRKQGDAALLDYTARFDRLELSSATLRVSAEELAAAESACDPETLAALRLASDRIRAYHEKQMPENQDYRDAAGVRLGARWTPLSAVGLYVPGGTASYPSSVLMNVIPAQVAGVKRLAVTTPTPEGKTNPLVLAALSICGVSEVYRIGGAQAVAALAYGTASIAPVDKITGPGNAFVAMAKRQVFGRVGIDMIAGPSEILVVADKRNNPVWVAADLLSQAEHDASSQSILITDDGAFGTAVARAVEVHLQSLSRAEIARASWQSHGAIIQVQDLAEAPALVDAIAPEHLELAVDDPDALMAKISHAGSIFLGRNTPEAIGDYVAGPNHVLPTERSARFSSGLNVLDFMKRTSFLGCDAASLRAIGPAAIKLAKAEGLTAHALSVALRLEDGGQETGEASAPDSD